MAEELVGVGDDMNNNNISNVGNFRYLIVRPESGGMLDVFRLLFSSDRASGAKFLQTSDDDDNIILDGGGGGRVLMAEPDHRWLIIVSIIMTKVLGVVGKPMEWSGYLFEFFLNLLSLNDNLLGLIYNLLRGILLYYSLHPTSF